MYKNVKSIQFNITFDGNGCVNYDSNEQGQILRDLGLIKDNNKNVKYAKKVFMPDGSFLYKVSSECLGRAMYEHDIKYCDQKNLLNKLMLYTMLSSVPMIEKGYMFASKTATYKRKSAISLPEAVEIGKPRTFLHSEMKTRSGFKDTSDSEKSDNTIFKDEIVGKLEYGCEGHIDLCELQFLSGDVTYDRMGADPKDEEIKYYIAGLQRAFPDMEDIHFGYYYIPGNCLQNEHAERGVLLDSPSTVYMAKDILKRLYNLKVNRSHAWLKTKFLKITFVMDNGKTDEIEIKSMEDIDNLEFTAFKFYELADEPRVKANWRLADEIEKKMAKAKKEAEAKKKAKKNNQADDDEDATI